MKLSYVESHGFFAKEDQIDESSMHKINDPYNYFNDKNAIMLNCKNPDPFLKVYEQAIEKHFSKQQQAEGQMN